MHFARKLIFTATLLLKLSVIFSEESVQNASDFKSPANGQSEASPKNSENPKAFEILNDTLIASITGFSENPLALKCAKLSHPLAVIFKCSKRLDGRHTITLLDYYMPEHQGLIASTVPYNASEENLAWLDTILASDGSEFVIKRPQELEEAQSAAEEFLEGEGIAIQRNKEGSQTKTEADGKNEDEPANEVNESETGDASKGAPFENATNEESDEAASTDKALSPEEAALTDEKQEADEDLESAQTILEDFEYANDNSELEALIQSSNSAIEKETKEEEKVEAIPEKKIKNAENMLSMYSYGNEVFTIKERENRRISITAFEKKLMRQYFDNRMRIIKRETWDLTGGITGAHKTKTENYAYNGDSTIAQRSTTIEGDTRYQQKYDENGRIIERRNFTVLKEDESQQNNAASTANAQNSTGSPNTSNAKNSTNAASTATSAGSPAEKKRKVRLNSRTTWKYNANGQISEKYFVEYNYKDENSTQIVSRASKKEVYVYKIQDGSPDYSYYENNVLRMKTEYSGLNDYKTTSYFDGGFIVESYYENGMHKRDYYYLQGSLVRSRDYE